MPMQLVLGKGSCLTILSLNVCVLLAGPSYLSRTMPYLSLPPMPFLPVPMELVCPSKAICEEQQQQQRIVADKGEQQQQQETEEEEKEEDSREGVDKQSR